MRKILIPILLFICFLLQNTLFRHLTFAGIGPNLLIILTSSVGFMRGEKAGLLTGFFGGLMYDVFFGTMIGFYALILMYVGFLNGKFSRVFYPEDIKLPMALIASSDLTYELLCYVTMFLLRGRLHFVYYLTKIILPGVLYTMVVTLFLYPVILLVNNFIENKTGRSSF